MGEGNGMKAVLKYKFPVISIRDVMDNMVHVIIVAVYLCVKFFKRLRVFITKKIFFLF